MRSTSVSLLLTRRYVTELIRSPRASAALGRGAVASRPGAATAALAAANRVAKAA